MTDSPAGSSGYSAQGSSYLPREPGFAPLPDYPLSPDLPGTTGYLAQGQRQSSARQLRPGRVWYLLALTMMAAGVAWLVVGLLSLSSTVDGLQRVSLPGGGMVSLPHSGGYTVYYEGPGAQSGSIPAFHIHVAPVSAGAAASSLTQYGSTVTYNFGSHHGRAVLTLHVTSPGIFAVSATGAPSQADLAFGGSIGSGILSVLLAAIPLIIIGAFCGAALLIVRIVRKRSMRTVYDRS